MATDHHVELTDEERAELEAEAARARRAEIAAVRTRGSASIKASVGSAIHTARPRSYHATTAGTIIGCALLTVVYAIGGAPPWCIGAASVGFMGAWMATYTPHGVKRRVVATVRFCRSRR